MQRECVSACVCVCERVRDWRTVRMRTVAQQPAQLALPAAAAARAFAAACMQCLARWQIPWRHAARCQHDALIRAAG